VTADHSADEFQRKFDQLCGNVERFILGKSDVVRLALICLLSEGHLLLEAVPGVAKTSLARAIAKSISGEVRRIQFTPDLLPSDITGTQIYDLERKVFAFRAGPVFTNVLIGDEINRAAPRTQSALLEVMAERQVTMDGTTRPVPRPFLCIATQNPIEHQGTYPLPEAQLDRFMMRIDMGYPGLRDEVDIITGGLERRTPDDLTPVMTAEDLRRMIKIVEQIYVSPALRTYIATITQATRKTSDVRLGASPRASIAVAVCAQARAASLGRTFATTDDVKAIAVPVLNHRLILTAEAAAEGVEAEPLLQEILSQAPVPHSQGGEIR
jgi:MoxR-like ATPase